MKVFLMAYARKNLGDDLFLKMILDRYPMHDFYMKIRDYNHLADLDGYSNLHVMNDDDTDEMLYNMDVCEYDAYIYVGGSIFMEGGKVYNLSEKFYDFVRRCKESNKPFCYVSCNYGPYQTQEYFDLSRKNFAMATDICFRDKYSYNLFKDIETVRYAPDLAFTYKLNKQEKIKNSIGISVIDLSIRNNLRDKEPKYIEMMVKNIRQYVDQGKKVYLFSFCEHEEDERTINILIEKLNHNESVIPVRFSGDLDSFLNTYSQMEHMICARFHALILSCVARQNMYVMSYSKKIDNVIEDLELKVPILHFEDVDGAYEIKLEDFVSVPEERATKIIEDAKGQLQAIDKVLR